MTSKAAVAAGLRATGVAPTQVLTLSPYVAPKVPNTTRTV